MNDTTSSRKELIGKYLLLMLAISFLGWCMETAVVSIPRERFYDRGFLTLPFCTIYGFSLLCIYALFGTPDRGGFLLGKIKNRPLRYLTYFLSSALIVTAFELATGLFFEWLFDIELWTYAHRPLNFMGYISLDYSIMWGFLITAIMKLVFPPLMKGIWKIPYRISHKLATALFITVAIDFSVNVLLLLL